MAITWRNVASTIAAPNPQQLTAGSQGLQRSLAAIGDVIENQQKVSQQNFQVDRQNNTNAFLDQVAGASVDQLSNPEFAAQLRSQAAAAGQSLDQNAVRGAVSKQLATRQQDSVTAQAYNDNQALQTAAPVIDDLRNKALSGDRAAVNQGIASLKLPMDAEGKIAQQFNGLLDDYENRQRADRTEQRSVAAQRQSMAAQSLSMELTRMNMEDVKDNRRQNDLGSSAAFLGFQDTQNAQDATRSVLKDIAGTLNLPRDDNGFADMGKLTAEQKTAYNDEIVKSGVKNNTSATDSRRRVLESVMQAGGDARAVATAAKTLDSLQALNNLAPEDQARAQSSIEALNEATDMKQAKRLENFKTVTSRNAFLTPEADPIKAANTVVSSIMNNKEITLTSSNAQQELQAAVMDLTTNGRKITVNGKERTVPIPSSLIQSAVTGTDLNSRSWTPSSSLSPVENLNAAIDNLLASEGVKKQLTEAETAKDSFTRDMANYANEKVSNAAEVVKRYQGDKMDPTPILTNALNQRKPR